MPTTADALKNEATFTRFDRMSEAYPGRTAIIYLGESFSYRRLRELSERFAGALADLGVRKGDRVMVYIANSVQWVIAFLGIQKAGAVIVPVSPIYTSHEIAYMIQDSGAAAIVCMDTNYGYVNDALAKIGPKQVIVTNLTDLLPGWKRVLGTLCDKIPSGKVGRDGGVHRFRALLRHAPIAAAAPASTEALGGRHLDLLGGQIQIDVADGAANITSALQRLVPSEADGNGDIQQEPCDDQDVEDRESCRAYNGALDGMESLLLALAAEGVLTTDKQAGVDRALQATLNALENQF